MNNSSIEFTLKTLSLNRFDSSTSLKRAHTTVTSNVNIPIHERRSYATVSTIPHTATRKPRSFTSSATSMIKT